MNQFLQHVQIMRYKVTYIIEAENKEAAYLYGKAKILNVESTEITIEKYKTTAKMNYKFEAILNHPDVQEINATKGIIMLKTKNVDLFKGMMAAKLYHNKVIFENVKLEYFLDKIYKKLFTKKRQKNG